ncbi:plasmid partitioning protein RepB [Polycladidibacter hongkongensis]|uniref:plasmid partitioning protein RepB n=1 Tax=Polycladidibacter hongkongensis TaxID=1647556 RepID=UPI00082FD219|nr:plasmid partitioning protein RepB [Pseudovibrio hongkongensis]
MNKAKDRKNALDSLFGGGTMADLAAAGASSRPRLSSGAIGAAEINLIKDERDRLKAELAELSNRAPSTGDIIDLDTALVFPSFVADRMEVEFDPAFEALKESIAESGQQVPILVRPHPEKEECYQIAYGHRRWRACRELGVSVKGTVRALDNEQLLVAQGQENHERKDLSFIETCLFVYRLAQDYPQSLIVRAIGKDKSLISKYRKLAASIPEELLRQIGPAPKIGRPRWEEFASFFEEGAVKPEYAENFTQSLQTQSFLALGSDDRFSLLLDTLQKVETAPERKGNTPVPSTARKSALWLGQKQVKVLQGAKQTQFVVDHSVNPQLADYLQAQIPELLERFAAENGEDSQ